MSLTLLFAILFFFIPFGLFAYGMYRAFFKLPHNHPKEFLQRGRGSTTTTLVVCAGDSLTHATLSADYVAMLRHQLGDHGYEFVNAGINGDLAYNLLQRLDDIVACQPDVVTILIGTNDVNATFDAKSYRGKNLPLSPTLDWYRLNLTTIASRLQEETNARIILLSLPVLGEDLSGVTNRKITTYSAAIQEIANAHGLMYSPLNEAFQAALKDTNSALPYAPGPLITFKTIGQHYLLGQSWNDVSARNGFYFLTDHIHLNERAAETIARHISTILTA